MTPSPLERLQIVLNQRSIQRRRVLHLLEPLDDAALEALLQALPPLRGDRLQDLRAVAVALALAVGLRRDGREPPEALDPYLARELELFEDPDLHLPVEAFQTLPPHRADPLLTEALAARRPRALHIAPSLQRLELAPALLEALATQDADRPHMPGFAWSLARGLPALRPALHHRLQRGDLTPFLAATLLDALALRPEPEDRSFALQALQRDRPGPRDAAVRLLIALGGPPPLNLPATPAAERARHLLTLPPDHPLAGALTALAFAAPADAITDALDARAAHLPAELPPWLPPAVLIAHATAWFLAGVDATHRFTWEDAIRPLLAASHDAAHALVAALLRYPASPDHARSVAWALRAAGPDAIPALEPLLTLPLRDDREVFFELAASRPDRLPAEIFQRGLQDPLPHLRTLCRNALRWRPTTP